MALSRCHSTTTTLPCVLKLLPTLPYVKGYPRTDLTGRKFATPDTTNTTAICEQATCGEFDFMSREEGDPNAPFDPCYDNIHLKSATFTSCTLRCKEGDVAQGTPIVSLAVRGRVDNQSRIFDAVHPASTTTIRCMYPISNMVPTHTIPTI